MIEDKEIRYIRYMTKNDPYVFRKFDFLVGKHIDKAKEMLPYIKFSDFRTEPAITCEAKYNWFRVNTSEDGIIEELINLYIDEPYLKK